MQEENQSGENLRKQVLDWQQNGHKAPGPGGLQHGGSTITLPASPERWCYNLSMSLWTHELIHLLSKITNNYLQCGDSVVQTLFCIVDLQPILCTSEDRFIYTRDIPTNVRLLRVNTCCPIQLLFCTWKNVEYHFTPFLFSHKIYKLFHSFLKTCFLFPSFMHSVSLTWFYGIFQ